MRRRPVPRRSTAGCGADQEYSGSTPYVGLGRAPNRFPTGKGANEDSGRPGGDHQGGGAHRRSHWGRHRPARTRRDRPRSPTGFAGDDGPTDSRAIRGNGRYGCAHGEKRDRGSTGQDGRTIGPYPRGQAGLRVHAIHLGRRFTQSTWDEEGYAIRDPDSTTYTGAIECAETFGKRIYWEAWKRGWSRARLKVVLGDGAEWIWNLADLHFPGAIQIVDLYHAREHLWKLARALHPNDQVQQKRWMMYHQNRLDKGRIEKLVRSLRSLEVRDPELREAIRIEANYFERNAARMRYPKFRQQHLFVGSGVIEAGCKTIIGSRTKQSGMFWTVRGANAIITLRCCQLNSRFEDYWEARRA